MQLSNVLAPGSPSRRHETGDPLRDRVFGAAALAAPAPAGRALAGDGGAAPDAQAILRGMGGREIGLGLGLLAMIRANGPIRPWIIAGLLADSGDITGIAGAWRHMPTAKRWLGLGMASAAAAVGATLHTTSRPLTSAVLTVPAKAFRSSPASSSSMSRSGSQLVEPPKDRGQREARG
jgi:hypothetical protein